MARKDRNGNRKTREQRRTHRVPEMGYYLIVTDTEATERIYFNGIYESLPEKVKGKLVIKVIETKTKKLVEECKEFALYDPQYRIPWIVFDRDKVVNFDDIIREAEAEGVSVGWSNPCFEIWYLLHFRYSTKSYCSNDEVIKELSAYIQDYSKSKDVFELIIGKLETAFKNAKKLEDYHFENGTLDAIKKIPSTEVYKIVDKIIQNKSD